ncbi:unnamed protein product [Diatraea saccharalis]|uniref:MD-2-related lipid-recognition domain-containing protein n=1 Tax=Diatraea saccharalis TaxID=40085 RepID=A0A9N9R840_9NEOP|nr:unnamed protein product [Diatraea saccharalis]
MNTLATAFVGIIPVPVPFPMGHLSAACDLLLDISCPVAKGHTINYELNIFMEPSVMLLNTRANVEFRIVDQDNQPLICIDVPFHIVPANSTMLAEN